MNLATVIVLLVVLAMVVLAIHTLRSGKGKCSCGSDGKNKEKCSVASNKRQFGGYANPV